jgi:hypothetical protein
MTVLIPRVRTINVRLSEEEYLELERFCVASGARSISDLVRSTMHSLVTGSQQENSLASSVIEYSAHVKELELRVRELAAELESFRTGVQPHHPSEPDATGETQPVEDAEISCDTAASQPPLPETDS